MPSLFGNLDTPKFIGPFEQLQAANVEAQMSGRNFLAGLQLAQESKAQKDRLGLQLKQFAMESEKHKLDVQQAHDSMDDAAEINKGREALNRGEDYVPNLKTIHGQNTWNAIHSQNTIQSAKQTLWKQYEEAIGYEAKSVSEFEGLKPFSKEWTDKLGVIQEQQRERKKVEALEQERAKAAIAEEKERAKQQAIGERTIKVRDAAGKDIDAIPMHDEEGKVIGYGVRNTQGGITQVRGAHPGNLSPEQRMDLNDLHWELRQAKTKLSGLTPKDKTRPAVEAQIKELETQIRNFGAQPASNPTTEPSTGDPLGLFK